MCGVCSGSSLGIQFGACWINWRLRCPRLCVGVSGPAGKGALSRWVPALRPELLETLQPPGTRRWHWFGKSFFLLIFLKCLYSSHLSHCVMFEGFETFIYKCGATFVTRNWP